MSVLAFRSLFGLCCHAFTCKLCACAFGTYTDVFARFGGEEGARPVKAAVANSVVKSTDNNLIGAVIICAMQQKVIGQTRHLPGRLVN